MDNFKYDNVFIAISCGSVSDLISELIQGYSENNYLVIAISGFGGAGKSTLAKQIQDELGNAVTICVDEFIVNRLKGNLHCWDGIDWNRLTQEVLSPVRKRSDIINYGIYDWIRNEIIETRTIDVPKYVIIEGVGLLRPELMPYFDYSVWIDIPLEFAMQRGMKRDRQLYYVDNDEQWKNIWSINDREYFEKYQPMELANFILKL